MLHFVKIALELHFLISISIMESLYTLHILYIMLSYIMLKF